MCGNGSSRSARRSRRPAAPDNAPLLAGVLSVFDHTLIRLQNAQMRNLTILLLGLGGALILDGAITFHRGEIKWNEHKTLHSAQARMLSGALILLGGATGAGRMWSFKNWVDAR